MLKFKSTFAHTIFYFGIMEISIGAAFFLLPELHVRMLGLPEGSVVLARVVGFLTVCFGYYYIRFGLIEDRNFAQFSVHVRIVLTFFWLLMLTVGLLPPMFAGLAIYDGAGAIWTLMALRRPVGVQD